MIRGNGRISEYRINLQVMIGFVTKMPGISPRISRISRSLQVFFVFCGNRHSLGIVNLNCCMLKKERHAYIIHQLNLHNRILSSQLCQDIEVSEDTVRRDLSELDQQGYIIKVHGGALSKSFHNSFQEETFYSKKEKNTIALKAVGLIEDGMFILTSGGTTIIELARALPENLHATFITVSVPAAYEYMKHPHIDVIIVGDKLSKSAKITVGSSVISRIKEIRADICFLGINAIDIEHGLTDNDWDVVQVKRAMIEASSKVIALTISEKVNTHQQLKVCDVEEMDILITERDRGHGMLQPYEAKGIHIL